jgi:hypothetical protein
MVGHQAIGMYLSTGLLARLGESLNKIVPIYIIKINALAAIPSAHDMVHRTRVLDTQFARHVANNKVYPPGGSS